MFWASNSSGPRASFFNGRAGIIDADIAQILLAQAVGCGGLVKSISVAGDVFLYC
jgi:hypothetical protein